jgi:hypothetical protein
LQPPSFLDGPLPWQPHFPVWPTGASSFVAAFPPNSIM